MEEKRAQMEKRRESDSCLLERLALGRLRWSFARLQVSAGHTPSPSGYISNHKGIVLNGKRQCGRHRSASVDARDVQSFCRFEGHSMRPPEGWRELCHRNSRFPGL